jgi:3-oxoadipate enol-lactonase
VTLARHPDGTRLHYEVAGRRNGPPVLMVQGLGTDSHGWILQRFALGGRYRLILMDNRGAGRSDKPPGPYDLTVMAEDAVAVLDHAGVRSAHVIGASMGGVIAQILAVGAPERVRSLVLACTACRHHEWRRELLAEWAVTARERGMRALAGRNLRWLVGPRSVRRFWPAFGLVGPLAMTMPPHAFEAQVHAILAMEDDLRFALGAVTVPTLVVVGSQDVLTPAGDSEELAALIPGAELVVVRGGAHGFMIEHAGAFNAAVLSFLARAEATAGDVTGSASGTDG